MNKDKAIQLLERLQDPEPYEPMLTKDAYDAIQMAIDALSADGDTISRKSAIGVLHEALDRVDQIADVPFGVYQNYRYKMNELPPAQPKLLQPWEVLAAQAVLPQPKMGKWIYHTDDLFPAESTMECNQCHAEQPLTCDDEFCPHCGAKMEVTE